MALAFGSRHALASSLRPVEWAQCGRTSLHVPLERALGPLKGTAHRYICAGGLVSAACCKRHPRTRRRCQESLRRHATVEDLTITESRFCHGWTISQLQEGYRYCADDILCAYYALKAAPHAKSLLDLGSGIGTIGLAWLAQQPRGAARVTMLEAQDVSTALCRRTLQKCQVQDEVELRHVDLRDGPALRSLGTFDVVTANPPYLSSTSGNLPNNSQKAYCRHELRGGVAEFCSVAKSAMAPGALFCMIHAAIRLPDVMEALQKCRFDVWKRVDVLFRGNLKSVAVICSLEPRSGGPPVIDRLNVQEEDGKWSSDYIDICAEMGL